MNMEAITLQDCIENYEMKGQAAIINDGQVLGFEQVEENESGFTGGCVYMHQQRRVSRFGRSGNQSECSG